VKTRTLMITALVAGIAVPAVAEPMRPLLTKENKFPDVGQAELGALVQFKEFSDENEQMKTSDANQWVVTPTLRYMASENLAFVLDVPFGGLDPDNGSSESGLGDIGVGVQFRVYEHFFRFPYIIPYANLLFDTGEEKALLGDRDDSLLIGVTVGSQVYDVPWYVNFDANYEVLQDSENIAKFAASVIWEISPQFSLLAEASLSDEDLRLLGVDEHPAVFQGGAFFKSSDVTTLGLYGSGTKNAGEDNSVGVRIVHDL
jgi:hypothetical protein